jgi:hypothetical protein
MLCAPPVQAEERTAFEEAAAREAERHRAAWEQDMRDKEKLAVALGDKASFEVGQVLQVSDQQVAWCARVLCSSSPCWKC